MADASVATDGMTKAQQAVVTKDELEATARQVQADHGVLMNRVLRLEALVERLVGHHNVTTGSSLNA